MNTKNKEDHMFDLRIAFERMRSHHLKINHLKCAFGVSARNFLGFLVHHRGIEVDQNDVKAILQASYKSKGITMVPRPGQLSKEIYFQLGR